MHPLRFIALDGLASFVSVPLFLGLGYAFGNQLTRIQEDISQIRTIMLLILIAGVGLYIIARYLNVFWRGPEGGEQ